MIEGYDIIGDIHGEGDALERLLQELDYKLIDGRWQHPPAGDLYRRFYRPWAGASASSKPSCLWSSREGPRGDVRIQRARFTPPIGGWLVKTSPRISISTRLFLMSIRTQTSLRPYWTFFGPCRCG